MNWLLKNKFISFFSITGFILINIGFLCICINFKTSEPLILHYAYPIGITLIDNFFYVLKFWVTALIIWIINFILVKKLNEGDIFLSKFFAVFNFFINLLIFVYFMSIIYIN